MSAVAQEIETRVCTRCGDEKPIGSFGWQKDSRYKDGGHRRTVCQQCTGKRYRANVKADPQRSAAHRAYMSAYYRANPWKRKIKCYQWQDRKRGQLSLSMIEGCTLILNNPCFYCGETQVERLGLDRIDNDRGHDIENVKVCCEVCNNILSDLPFTVKELLGRGLREARERGFLTGYVIKTKRKREAV